MKHVFDERAKAAFLQRIGRGRSPAIAAEEVGFALSTIQRTLKTDPAFRDAFSDKLSLVNGAVEEVLLEKALEGDFQSIKTWLTNRASDRWKDSKTLHTEISGPGGAPVQVVQHSVEALRVVLADPSTRANALDMVQEMPAIEAEGRES